MRRWPRVSRGWYLGYTLGACQEFSNATTLTQPSFYEVDPFVSLEAASFCISGSDAQTFGFWMCSLGVVVFLCSLMCFVVCFSLCFVVLFVVLL